MVKNHSDSEKGNPLPPHGLLFPISKQGFFYMHHPTDRITHTKAFVKDRITHTTAFVAPVVEDWMEQEIHTHKHIRTYISTY